MTFWQDDSRTDLHLRVNVSATLAEKSDLKGSGKTKARAYGPCGKDGRGTDATSIVASTAVRGADSVCTMRCCSRARPVMLQSLED